MKTKDVRNKSRNDGDIQKMNPIASIILPGWNERKTLKKTISYLKNQEFEDFNVILILGGEDSYLEEIEEIKWEKLIVLEQIEPNKSKALNIALKNPNLGEILIFSDIDSYFPPNYINQYVKAFQDPNKNVIAGRAIPFQNDTLLNKYLTKNEERRISNYQENEFSLSGVNFAMRKSFISNTFKYFNEEVKISSDSEINCTLRTHNEKIYLDKSIIVHTDFNADSIFNFLKQQSRWFRNVLVFGKDFTSKGTFIAHLLLSLISWSLYLFIPLFFILSSIFIKLPLISFIFLLTWVILFGFLFQKRFRDLIRNEHKPKIICISFFQSIIIAIIYSFIPIVGSLKAIYVLITGNKYKSWKK